MKIKIGDFEVIAEGSVIGNFNESIIFYFEDLKYEFNFKTEEATAGNKIDARQGENDKSVLITFINFDNPLGSGNLTPIKFGVLNGKDLFLNYRIYPLKGEKGDAGKTFHYTWLTKAKEEVSNG